MAEKKDRTTQAALVVIMLQTVALVLMLFDSPTFNADMSTLRPVLVMIRDWVATVPTKCWWWLALTVYLVYAWLYRGPKAARAEWALIQKKGRVSQESGFPFLMWLFAPVWVVVLWVLYPMWWLAYGTTSTEPPPPPPTEKPWDVIQDLRVK